MPATPIINEVKFGAIDWLNVSDEISWSEFYEDEVQAAANLLDAQVVEFPAVWQIWPQWYSDYSESFCVAARRRHWPRGLNLLGDEIFCQELTHESFEATGPAALLAFAQHVADTAWRSVEARISEAAWSLIEHRLVSRVWLPG